MEIIQRAQLGTQSDSIGTSDLIDWVYYHDSLSRFALFHWRHKSLAAEPAAPAQITPYPPLLAGRRPVRPIPSHLPPTKQSKTCPPRCPAKKKHQPLPLQSPTHGILNVLSEICSVLLDPSDPRSHDASYKERLRALEWKVDSLPSVPTSTTTTTTSSSPSISSSSSSSPSPNNDYDSDDETPDITIHLYKAATRIYLSRATQNPHHAPADLSALLAPAFAGPVRTCLCRHFFPLLIVACEARGEDQRAAILNLISRTEGRGYVRSMATFRAQVCAFWTQRDLCDDEGLVLDYLGVMRGVVSSERALPSYV